MTLDLTGIENVEFYSGHRLRARDVAAGRREAPR